MPEYNTCLNKIVKLENLREIYLQVELLKERLYMFMMMRRIKILELVHYNGVTVSYLDKRFRGNRNKLPVVDNLLNQNVIRLKEVYFHEMVKI